MVVVWVVSGPGLNIDGVVFRVAGRKELSRRQREHMEGVAELLTELYNAIVCEGQ